jgi:hypothetical protein
MLLFTVTMKSNGSTNGSTNEKDRFSRAVHVASIAAGYPEDDFLHQVTSGLISAIPHCPSRW